MGHQPPCQQKILPPTCKYLATIYPAKFLITTHIYLTTLYVSMLHRSLKAHTHLPLDYACPEAVRHTTHQSTVSQLARLTLNSTPKKKPHSIIASHNQKPVRLMNAKVLEIKRI